MLARTAAGALGPHPPPSRPRRLRTSSLQVPTCQLHTSNQGFGSGWIRIVFGSRIRITVKRWIRIHITLKSLIRVRSTVKSWIWLRVKVKIHELSKLKMKPWRAVEAQNRGVEAQNGDLEGL
jgi:hypothetical protein